MHCSKYFFDLDVKDRLEKDELLWSHCGMASLRASDRRLLVSKFCLLVEINCQPRPKDLSGNWGDKFAICQRKLTKLWIDFYFRF